MAKRKGIKGKTPMAGEMHYLCRNFDFFFETAIVTI